MDFNATVPDLYSGRGVDRTWREICKVNLQPVGRDVADIGCGGGIYALAFAAMGARSVTGVDKSLHYLEKARELVADAGMSSVRFCTGNAMATVLADSSMDIIFERALIHHLSREEQQLNLREATRVLRNGGILAVQDRTIENVMSDNPRHWIRTTLFDCFPQLLQFERARRPSERDYQELLDKTGFRVRPPIRFSEIRKSYSSLSELRTEILTRKGKSILFELTDEQLRVYCSWLKKVSEGRRLVEMDQWTLWIAEAPMSASKDPGSGR